MIVVTLTSWLKRINNVKTVVQSIMKNTIQPDKVFLNLSKEEFKDIELQSDLVDYFNSNERLVINWVEGNTKSFKKLYPILKYLNDDDIIISADDDILFPKDLIEFRLKDFRTYGGKYPISSSNRFASEIKGAMVIAPVYVVTKKMLKNWEKLIIPEIIATNNDDRTLLYLLYMNGYVAKPVTRYSSRGLCKNFSYNPICSMKENHLYPIGANYDKVVAPIIKRITGTTIQKSFNFFEKYK